MARKRKQKKTFWKEYIKVSRKDRELLAERNQYKYYSTEFNKLDKKILSNLHYINSLSHALIQLVKPRSKCYLYRLAHIFLIGKIYKWYFKINNRTFKYHGPITIIGKSDKNGYVEYPNTRWNRITKLHKFIR